MDFCDFPLLGCRARAALVQTMRLRSAVLTLCWQKCQGALMKNPEQGINPPINAGSEPTEVSWSSRENDG